jgi:hypothetical protein
MMTLSLFPKINEYPNDFFTLSRCHVLVNFGNFCPLDHKHKFKKSLSDAEITRVFSIHRINTSHKYIA